MLEELEKQTFRDFEIVVVDQGSTDGAPEEIEKQYPQIKVIRLQKNAGVPAGMNIGAVNARGEILVFLDNDAVLKYDGLQMLPGMYLSG